MKREAQHALRWSLFPCRHRDSYATKRLTLRRREHELLDVGDLPVAIAERVVFVRLGRGPEDALEIGDGQPDPPRQHQLQLAPAKLRAPRSKLRDLDVVKVS